MRLDKISDSTMRERCQTYSGRVIFCLAAFVLKASTGHLTLQPEVDHKTVSYLALSASMDVGTEAKSCEAQAEELSEAAADFIVAKTRSLQQNK